ncbi:hypothetical protein TNCV_1680021 [Trichonephila clavipes]|nr:hypothetical protein TNCV_1680021 [Trichonephila clavipes]
MNLVSVCGGMTAVNEDDHNPENAANQLISSSRPTKRIVGAPNTVFQQDNARHHVARQILHSLTRFNILPWSANIPDLILIEQPRDLIGRDMNRGPLAQTVDDLCTTVDEAWQQLRLATINGLIDRMSRRIEAYITARGGDIRY